AEAMHMCFGQADGKRAVFWVHDATHPQTIAVMRTRAEPIGIDLRIGTIAEHAAAADASVAGALRSYPATDGQGIDRRNGNAKHPQTIAVMRTRAEPIGIDLRIGTIAEIAAAADASVAGALLSYPTTDGQVIDLRDVIAKLHAAGASVACATDLLALTLLTPPGELGADIALGTAQRFGVPLGFGGPHAAFLSAKDSFRRQMPGRIIGVSRDAKGKTAFRLALQTREQHIRREK